MSGLPIALDTEDSALAHFLDNDVWTDTEDEYNEGEGGGLLEEENDIIDIIETSKRGKRCVVNFRHSFPNNSFLLRFRRAADTRTRRDRVLLQNEAWESIMPALKEAYKEFELRGPPEFEPDAQMHPAIWVIEMFGVSDVLHYYVFLLTL